MEAEWNSDELAFGRYEARISLVYGDNSTGQSTMTANTSFWVMPLSIVKPALITLGVISILVYIVVKVYVRRKVAAATRGRRMVRRRDDRGSSALLMVAVVII